MKTSTRKLLIVEDDPTLNMLYKLHCEVALQEMPQLEAEVEQAFNYEQARQILETQPISFVSVDIALGKEEHGKTERDRDAQETSGMTLLRELQNNNQQHPLVVVVSGEMLQSYVLDAYRKYGVLAFYQKTRLNEDEFKHAVKAALLFLEAAEAMLQPQTELDLYAAQQSWQKALAAAQIAGIRGPDFPEDIGKSIQLLLSRRTHAITNLPNNYWTEDQLRAKIVGRSNWGLILVTVSGFTQFVASYASQEEPILFFVARLLTQTRAVFQDDQIFIGHLGHYEYTPDPRLVLIPGEKSSPYLAEIVHWINDRFTESGSTPFTHALAELNQAELEFTVKAKAITSAAYSFQDLHALLDTLSSTPSSG